MRSADLAIDEGTSALSGRGLPFGSRRGADELKVSVGQCSDKGRKDSNQDCYGAITPGPPMLAAKGIAVALADGISSSFVSRIASEAAVKGFLEDYYCTAESWSVKTSAQRVIAATNSWLYVQTRRGANPYDKDKGYVCTLSALVIKSATAHIFHVGDARVYRVNGNALEQLTEDHRIAVSSERSYLSRALGAGPQVEIDYIDLPVERGDTFVLMTDGVHEFVDPRLVVDALRIGDLDAAAQAIVSEAFSNGSPDNLTVQIVRVDGIPQADANEVAGRVPHLPLPPLLEAGTTFDGYRIVRELHASHRSHIYLTADGSTGALVALKIPSLDLRGNPNYLRHFLMEEWIARRVNSPHLLKAAGASRKRNYLYVVTEFVEGQSLAQWMIDNPAPDLETVRGIVEQIAKGLQALHRMEMLHQDLRPENIMLDKTGTAKIIDFGSVMVAGVDEMEPATQNGIRGTLQYTAPEYFLGEGGSVQSDLFSLGVIAYQMLTGRLPYGAQAARVKTRADLRRLRYRSALREDRDIPAWVDLAVRRAVHPDRSKRHEALSEFVFDLRHPNRAYAEAPRPLLERDPLLFWKGLSALLAAAVLALLLLVTRH